jgi:hypothetical protein
MGKDATLERAPADGFMKPNIETNDRSFHLPFLVFNTGNQNYTYAMVTLSVKVGRYFRLLSHFIITVKLVGTIPVRNHCSTASSP